MAEFPALPLWTDAFVGDTTHLSCELVGAYILLLFAAWRRPECDLPDEDRFLAQITRCDVRTWRKHYRPALAPFHTIAGGVWTQKRLHKERKHVADLSRKMRENAERRWSKNKDIADVDAMQRQCNGNAPIPIPNKKERILSAAPQTDHLDFEKFWTDYPREKNMSKKRALMAWRKLTPEKRVQATAAIPGYRSYIEKNKSWYHAVHAERFLSQERFEGFEAERQVTAEEMEIAIDRADRILRRGKYAPQY